MRAAAITGSDAVDDRDTLELFGNPRCRLAGAPRAEPLAWQIPIALLVFLALRPGWHARESVAALLRPNAAASDSRGYLRQLLHRIRKALPGLSSLRLEDDRIGWFGTSDVQAFHAAVDQRRWTEAVSLQSSPLLRGMGSTGNSGLDEWIDEEKERLRQRLAKAFVGAIDQRQASGSDSSDLMQAAADLSPMEEDLVVFLLRRSRTPLERRVAASAYQQLSRWLVAELGHKPSTGTVQAFLEFQAAPPEAVTPTAVAASSGTAPASDNRVPRPPPLGRDNDLEALEKQLRAPGVRLLALRGPGGVGKTHLARALFDRLAGDPGLQTLVWVDLGAAESARALLDAIATQTGMPPADGPLEDQLVRWLGTRQVLLFLDNFEQLVGESALLARLLANAPGLRLVVTSREALSLAQEHAFLVQGLAWQGKDSPAVQLFAECTRRLGCVLQPDDLPHVQALVQCLEGLPLAIELAAHWAPVLPVAGILAELRADPAFIDGARPGAVRGMRSIFDATWRRLTPEQRDALVAVATVAGPLDFEAAQAVSGAAPATLLQLVAKSLLHRMADGMLGLHALVREFVLRKADPAYLAAVRERHCRHFLGLLAREPALRIGHYVPERVNALLPRIEDLTRAWHHATAEGLWDVAATAQPNLAGLLIMGARFEEAEALARDALQRVDPLHPMAGDLFVMQALGALRRGSTAQAHAAAAAGMHGSTHGPARAALHLVLAHLHRFTDMGPAHALQALALIPPADAGLRMWVHDELATGYWTLHRLDAAEPWIQANLELARREQAVFYEARAWALLGFVRRYQGRTHDALNLMQTALAMFRRIGDLYQCALCLRVMSQAFGDLGETDQQIEAARGALDAFEAGGYTHELADSRLALASAWIAGGRIPEAAALCLRVLRHSLGGGETRTAVICIGVAGAMLAMEDRARGLALMAFALAHPQMRQLDAACMLKRVPRIAPEGLPAPAGGDSFEAICSDLLTLTEMRAAAPTAHAGRTAGRAWPLHRAAWLPPRLATSGH